MFYLKLLLIVAVFGLCFFYRKEHVYNKPSYRKRRK